MSVSFTQGILIIAWCFIEPVLVCLSIVWFAEWIDKRKKKTDRV